MVSENIEYSSGYIGQIRDAFLYCGFGSADAVVREIFERRCRGNDLNAAIVQWKLWNEKTYYLFGFERTRVSPSDERVLGEDHEYVKQGKGSTHADAVSFFQQKIM